MEELSRIFIAAFIENSGTPPNEMDKTVAAHCALNRMRYDCQYGSNIDEFIDRGIAKMTGTEYVKASTLDRAEIVYIGPETDGQIGVLMKDVESRVAFFEQVLPAIMHSPDKGVLTRIKVLMTDYVAQGYGDGRIYKLLRGEVPRPYALSASRASKRAREIQRYAPKNVKSYLDFGCNDGSITSAVAAAVGAGYAAGWDVHPQGFPHGVEITKLVDGEPLPKKKKFDFVTSLMVLHHVRGVDRVLRDLRSVMTKGATLLIREHDSTSDRFAILLDVMHAFYAVVLPDTPEMESFTTHYSSYLSKSDFIALIETAGFQLVRETKPEGPWRFYYAVFKAV